MTEPAAFFNAHEARPVEYPRRLLNIQQIEITTRCNLKCKYCPSPQKPRPHEDMSLETFERALDWTRYLLDKNPQRPPDFAHLWLHGIGESMMHPDFLEFCRLARARLPDVHLMLSTNGLLLTEEIAKGLAETGVVLEITAHVPSKVDVPMRLALKYGILGKSQCNPATHPTDWAGQIDWPNPLMNMPERLPCGWLQRGWGLVMVDGSITTCCVDATGAGIVGHVRCDPRKTEILLRPYSLCAACHLKP